MRVLGIMLLLVGAIWVGVALNLPTTIKMPDQYLGAEELQISIPATEVYNLQLADSRRTHLFIASTIVIVGAIAFGFGFIGSHTDSQVGSLKKCPFCAELIQPDALLCKHCGKNLPPLSDAIESGTPLLMQAAVAGDFDTAYSLLREGVDINKKNKDGKAAVDLARELGNSRIVDLLLSNGASFKTDQLPDITMTHYKYQGLENLLRTHPSTTNEVTLSFEQIEAIIGDTLPSSASNYREWWANQSDTSQRPQAKAWISAGFIVDEVHQEQDSWIRFKRSEAGAEQSAVPNPIPDQHLVLVLCPKCGNAESVPESDSHRASAFTKFIPKDKWGFVSLAVLRMTCKGCGHKFIFDPNIKCA